MSLESFIETCDKHQDAACALGFLTVFVLVILFFGAYHIIKALKQPTEIHHHYNDDPE